MYGIKTLIVNDVPNYQISPFSRFTKNARTQYYELRHSIRRLRRTHPNHYDVLLYSASLGLDPIDDSPTRRIFYKSMILSVLVVKPRKPLP